MDSSDDEGVVTPKAVSGYYFEDAESRPISFAELPVQWTEEARPDRDLKKIYLRGDAENGLQKVHIEVAAWKCDISSAKLVILVLSKDNNWIKLERPRKSFEEEIRTILITVHCLHLSKRNPVASAKTLWDQLSRVFSLYDLRPSENDLISHIDFISEAVKRDEVLAKSKFLAAFLEKKSRKRKPVTQDAGMLTRPGFIVDDIIKEPVEDDLPNKDAEDEESEEENDLFDSVCAFCDDGGKLTCCEGKCLRSFHAINDKACLCQALGISAKKVKETKAYVCRNCEFDEHQCYVCGELGSSNKSMCAEVFQCSSATCGYFYHPQCVAGLLHCESDAEAEDLQEKIAAGNPFICPAHKCALCKQAENEDNSELQFATCRRCPNSYHRKCMPREIVFSGNEDVVARAWPKLLPKKRILIFCMDHEIDEELETPSRDHIKFPPSEPEENKKTVSELEPSDSEVEAEATNFASGRVLRKKSAVKPSKSVENMSAKKPSNSKKRNQKLSASQPSKKQKILETQISESNMLDDQIAKVSEQSNEDITAVGEHQHTQTILSKEAYTFPTLDDESRKRILAMIRETNSSVKLEDVIEKHKVPTTHAHVSNFVDTITLGKVERSLEALRLAVKMTEEGCSIEDTKAVCDSGVLQQILWWKSKLKGYLAPFLHGNRYTSFGRHFTKPDKLKKIVDILHHYVQEGDTIVDFCCGSNDFSCIMKKKLDETGKQCSFKNYDTQPAQNDFNFEIRDWFSVSPKELPSGSQLIMGLNPPFGVKASLANKFINRALEFKPKLLILIVPPETERLDRKHLAYDLIWEDEELLAGKSFYLPGSVDVNDMQLEQWNKIPPPLYLWSHRDWTSKHKAIAEKHDHIRRLEDNFFKVAGEDAPINDGSSKAEVPGPSYNQQVNIEEPKMMPQKSEVGLTGNRKSHSHDPNRSEVEKEKQVQERGRSSDKSKKSSGKRGWVSDDIFIDDKQRNHNSLPQVSQPHHSPLHSDTGLVGRDQFDRSHNSSRKHYERAHSRTSDDRHYERAYSRTHDNRHYERSYSRTHDDDMARGRSPNTKELYYGNRHSEAQFPGHQHENIGHGYYRSYERGVPAAVSQTSTMQRYAPRLDELNHTRINRLTPEPVVSSSEAYGHHQIPRHGVAYEHPVPQPEAYDHHPLPRGGPGVDILGFARGPHRTFSQNNSSGWLDE